MSILVVNCDGWVGFHLVNTLLEHDYIVDGTTMLDDTGEIQPIKDLTMFFGRNSDFSIVSRTDKKYSIGIIVGDFDGDISQNVEKLIIINPDKKQHKSIKPTNWTTINTSLLFGEWMPMDEKGLYYKEEYIPFTSEKFQKESIYIDDFTKAMMQWLEMPDLPQELNIYSSNDEEKQASKIEKNMYISENILNKDNLKNVIEHYLKFKEI